MSGRLWTLCVGVDDYGAQPSLTNRICGVADACAVHTLLAREFGGEGVLLASRRGIAGGPHPELVDIAQGAGTRAEILAHLVALSRRMRSADAFVLFFAGHTSADAPGYLIPHGGLAGRVSSYLSLRALLSELHVLPCGDLWVWLAARAPVEGATGAGLSPRPGSAALLAAARPDRELLERDPLGDGPYSAFGNALLDVLGRVEVGELLDADELATGVQKLLSSAAKQDGTAPTFAIARLSELRTGAGAPQFRRSGFAINLPRRLRCALNEELVLDLTSIGEAPAEAALTWEVRCTDESHPAEVGPGETESQRRLRFRRYGPHVVEVEARTADGKARAIREIVVDVAPIDEAPLTVAAKALPPCWRGKPYVGRLDVSGGRQPYRAHVEGLPPGLIAAAGDGYIEITGTMPAHSNPGSARAESSEPVGYGLSIAIEDARGTLHRVERRLYVVGTEYVEITSREFQVGYHDTPQRANSIADMLARHFGASSKRQAAQFAIERAQHLNPTGTATAASFLIRRYPVTNFEWRAYLRATGQRRIPQSSSWNKDEPIYFGDDAGSLPVVSVSAEAIRDYLAWRGTRLPTAREWERAARGPDGRLFPWGDIFDSAKCNTLESDVGNLRPVDAYDHVDSPDGVRDMVGNAAEWVDHRVWDGRQGVFAQPFRGGSFLDPCVQALTFFDSLETGVWYALGRGEHGSAASAARWVGFRDVVDLDFDPPVEQGAIPIPAARLAQGAKHIDVSTFEIARYAVSNAEYLEFVQASGHPPPPHWQGGQQEPFAFTARHLPVTHVSWHDAMAFCLWKSRRSRRVVRPQSADQWRAALSGGEDRALPWGEGPDLGRCNTRRSGHGRILPVHALPEGATVQGVQQLVGNVCEWTAPGLVIGGGWREDLVNLIPGDFLQRVSGSSLQQDGIRLDDVGFRYVVLSSELS